MSRDWGLLEEKSDAKKLGAPFLAAFARSGNHNPGVSACLDFTKALSEAEVGRDNPEPLGGAPLQRCDKG
jgi:hypothetical protein